MTFFLSLSLVLYAASVACGLSTQLYRREVSRSASSTSDAIGSGPDPFNFVNLFNVQYSATVHVSGYDFLVILDNGSSDLWLDVTNFVLPNVTDSGTLVSLGYADGSVAAGNVNHGTVTFGNYSVANQAFVAASGSNATRGGSEQGILGLGPPTTSVILQTLSSNNSSSNGKMFLQNLLENEADLPNLMTFLLSRGNLTGTGDGGIFTIGQIQPDLNAINDAPKLPIVNPAFWWTNIDGVLLNGKPIEVNVSRPTNAAQTSKGLNAILDTGTSYAFARREFVDAIYGNVPGATFNDTTRVYDVPCDTKLNVSLGFGGLQYPINPLDLIAPSFDEQSNKPKCTGSIGNIGANGPADFLLGDTFLRNVYSLYNFGNWTREDDDAPYMQLLSVTDIDRALNDFDALNQARLDALIAEAQAATSATENLNVSSTVTFQAPASSIVTSSTAPAATKSANNNAVAGALKDDDSDSWTVGDFDTLMRNSWVIIGLLALTILLLLGTLVTMLIRGREPGPQKYRSIQRAAPPSHGNEVDEALTGGYDGKKYSDYTDPYGTGGH